MSKKNFELSRRKILAGLGTAGVAAAGAGLGTTAWLNDTESLDNNVMQAGELDLILDYAAQYNQSGVIQSDGSQDTDGDLEGTFQVATGEIQGNATALIELTDVKPGDCGFIVLCPRLVDNPGHLWMRAAQTGDSENTPNPEPEPEGYDAEGGELDSEMIAHASYFFDTDTDELVPLSGNAENSVCGFAEIGPESSVIAGSEESSASDVLTDLSEGVRLDGSPFDQEEGIDPWPASGSEAGAPCITFGFHVPESVGNVIQGDSFDFDVEFYAEQARHNDDPDNPWAA